MGNAGSFSSAHSLRYKLIPNDRYDCDGLYIFSRDTTGVSIGRSESGVVMTSTCSTFAARTAETFSANFVSFYRMIPKMFIRYGFSDALRREPWVSPLGHYGKQLCIYLDEHKREDQNPNHSIFQSPFHCLFHCCLPLPAECDIPASFSHNRPPFVAWSQADGAVKSHTECTGAVTKRPRHKIVTSHWPCYSPVDASCKLISIFAPPVTCSDIPGSMSS